MADSLIDSILSRLPDEYREKLNERKVRVSEVVAKLLSKWADDSRDEKLLKDLADAPTNGMADNQLNGIRIREIISTLRRIADEPAPTKQELAQAPAEMDLTAVANAGAMAGARNLWQLSEPECNAIVKDLLDELKTEAKKTSSFEQLEKELAEKNVGAAPARKDLSRQLMKEFDRVSNARDARKNAIQEVYNKAYEVLGELEHLVASLKLPDDKLFDEVRNEQTLLLNRLAELSFSSRSTTDDLEVPLLKVAVRDGKIWTVLSASDGVKGLLKLSSAEHPAESHPELPLDDKVLLIIDETDHLLWRTAKAGGAFVLSEKPQSAQLAKCLEVNFDLRKWLEKTETQMAQYERLLKCGLAHAEHRALSIELVSRSDFASQVRDFREYCEEQIEAFVQKIDAEQRISAGQMIEGVVKRVEEIGRTNLDSETHSFMKRIGEAPTGKERSDSWGFDGGGLEEVPQGALPNLTRLVSFIKDGLWKILVEEKIRLTKVLNRSGPAVQDMNLTDDGQKQIEDVFKLDTVLDDSRNLISSADNGTGKPVQIRYLQREASVEDFMRAPMHYMKFLKQAAGTPAKVLGAIFLLFSPFIILGIDNPLKSLFKGAGANLSWNTFASLTTVFALLGTFLAAVCAAYILRAWKPISKSLWLQWTGNPLRWLFAVLIGLGVGASCSLMVNESALNPYRRSLLTKPPVALQKTLSYHDAMASKPVAKPNTIDAKAYIQKMLIAAGITDDVAVEFPKLLIELEKRLPRETWASALNGLTLGKENKVAIPQDWSTLLQRNEIEKDWFKNDKPIEHNNLLIDPKVYLFNGQIDLKGTPSRIIKHYNMALVLYSEITSNWEEVLKYVTAKDVAKDTAAAELWQLRHELEMMLNRDWINRELHNYEAIDNWVITAAATVSKKDWKEWIRPYTELDDLSKPKPFSYLTAMEDRLTEADSVVAVIRSPKEALKSEIKNAGDNGLTLDFMNKLARQWKIEDELAPAFKLKCAESMGFPKPRSEIGFYSTLYWGISTIGLILWMPFLLFKMSGVARWIPHWQVLAAMSVCFVIAYFFQLKQVYNDFGHVGMLARMEHLYPVTTDKSASEPIDARDFRVDQPSRVSTASFGVAHTMDPRPIGDSLRESPIGTWGPSLSLVIALLAALYFALKGHNDLVQQKKRDENLSFKQLFLATYRSEMESARQNKLTGLQRWLGSWLDIQMCKLEFDLMSQYDRTVAANKTIEARIATDSQDCHLKIDQLGLLDKSIDGVQKQSSRFLQAIVTIANRELDIRKGDE